jgi:hypothetical protein
MATTHDADTDHNTYRRTRDAFNEMNVEEQASFLVEATASMLARGVEEAGRAVAEGLDDLFRSKTNRSKTKSTASPRRGKQGPGPAEPETAQQRRPHGGPSGSSSH